MIHSFFGPYRPLSNFHPAVVVFNDIEFPSVENAYQYAKLPDELREDVDYIKFFTTCSAAESKNKGNEIQIRSDWSAELKLKIMEDLVRQKFQHNDLREFLRSTGHRHIIEGNTWNDTFWGVCCDKGSNHLGKILMLVRSEIHKPSVDDWIKQ